MAHDLVIRRGTVYDGHGGDGVAADVAIDDGVITAIGEVAEVGTKEIDASGHAVTPGFVDVHTHLDAQIGWDPSMTPSSWHGVTTALLGNCGVTFAPCKPEDRSTIANMMESVEDIPSQAILTGLPWTWENYGGYLDALEGLNPAINVTGMVGHCAVRYNVMGERSITDHPTDVELGQMADVVSESMDQGAIGFSTSRLLGHVMPDGRDVPGTHAERREIGAIADAISAVGGGLFQNVPDTTRFRHEADLFRFQASHDNVRVLFSGGVTHKPTAGNVLAGIVDGMAADGLDVTSICIPRSSGFIYGLVNVLPWRKGAWEAFSELDFEGRLGALHDSATYKQLLADADASPHVDAEYVYFLGDGNSGPHYMEGPEHSLANTAKAAGETPAATFLRMTLESNGRALWTYRIFNRSIEALADVLSSDNVHPGLGDAGAHVGQIMDAGWTSFVLSHWTRKVGLYTPGEAIRRMTKVPATVIGANDRGTLEVGKRADVNVIDLDNVGEQLPEYVHDFPGGAGRFVQRSVGYRATICNGQTILENGEHTGVRSGTVLRRG